MKLNTAIRGAQIKDAVAGDGLEWSTDDVMGLDLKASAGLKIDTGELSIEPADFAGIGLEDDGSDNLRLAAQGNGIAGGAGSTLSVNLDGTTLSVGASGVKLADLTDTYILVGDGTNVATGVVVSGDIAITNAGVVSIGATKVVDSMINDDVATELAGTGLTATNGVLSVDAVTDNIVEGDIQVENESANCNGSNVAFTLTNTPVANSLQVFLNGLLQESGSGKDYTWTGVTVTFAIAPATGDILLIHYIIDN